MKRFAVLLLSMFIAHFCVAQTYIALVPALVNTAGTFGEKTNVSFEVGRQLGVFSIGADVGKTNMGKVKGRDTTVYLEVRPNLNIFEHGKFTNTLTIGIGGVFNARENFMTELTTGMEYAFNDHYHFNANFGQYYYSGLTTSKTVTFFGLSFMHYFGGAKNTALVELPK